MSRRACWLPTLMLVVVLGGCASLPFVSHVPSLAYSHDPSVVVVEAGIQTMSGGPPPIYSCNSVPLLLVWGDGRTFKSDFGHAGRMTLTGRLDSTEIDVLLALLAREGFFEPQPRGVPLPSGGPTWGISLTLRDGVFRQSGNNPPPLLTHLLDAVPADHFSPFVPQLGLLVAEEGSRYLLGPTRPIPDWPARFGSTLRDATLRGQWIQGDALAFAWGVVNDAAPSVPFIRDGGTVYSVGLQIPGISYFDPSRDCLFRAIPPRLTPEPRAGP
jgi:hypothetical protein